MCKPLRMLKQKRKEKVGRSRTSVSHSGSHRDHGERRNRSAASGGPSSRPKQASLGSASAQGQGRRRERRVVRSLISPPCPLPQKRCCFRPRKPTTHPGRQSPSALSLLSVYLLPLLLFRPRNRATQLYFTMASSVCRSPFASFNKVNEGRER